MDATVELNAEAFDTRLTKLGWSKAEAARRIGVARSTIIRMRLGQLEPSGEFIASVIRTLGRPRQPPGSAFGEYFRVVDKH